eukprot:7016942-Prorocentrum_lima.AAC.1
MTSSLVGSEMCIRDRGFKEVVAIRRKHLLPKHHGHHTKDPRGDRLGSVSYTHLTLPTICSV